ncbi:MAG: hydrolase [Acidiferrobacter sp.]
MTGFNAPWWARNPHCQTVLGALTGRGRPEPLIRERIILGDGDFVDLDWLAEAPAQGPLLLVLHGLEGSSRSLYIRRLLRSCRHRQWRAVVMHFRGCSGEPNRLARSYHCGETGDLDCIIRILAARDASGICAVGFSLGGSVLLKWLGEQQTGSRLMAAAAVSVPFDLDGAAERLNRGFSRVYQWVLLRWLKRSQARKAKILRQKWRPRRALRTFRDFDDAVTAPLHGFTGADDYYQKASCRPYLRHITVPTLILQAADDPFLMSGHVPSTHELSPHIHLELSAHGGHVGFVAGGLPWAPRFWLNDRLGTFFAPYLSRAHRP